MLMKLRFCVLVYRMKCHQLYNIWVGSFKKTSLIFQWCQRAKVCSKTLLTSYFCSCTTVSLYHNNTSSYTYISMLINSNTKHNKRYRAESQSNSPDEALTDTSHWFPPLAKDVVDEFGHWLRATGASPTLLGFAAHAGVVHHLGEYDCHLLVMLSRRQLVELAVRFDSQTLTFFMPYLSHVAQVLFVAHQKYNRLHVPEGDRAEQEHTVNTPLWLCSYNGSGFH